MCYRGTKLPEPRITRLIRPFGQTRPARSPGPFQPAGLPVSQQLSSTLSGARLPGGDGWQPYASERRLTSLSYHVVDAHVRRLAVLDEMLPNGAGEVDGRLREEVSDDPAQQSEPHDGNEKKPGRRLRDASWEASYHACRRRYEAARSILLRTSCEAARGNRTRRPARYEGAALPA
jgi:hypothetical protein